MKIVTWNCQGAFRRKAAPIAQFRPDLAVIQECEAPVRPAPSNQQANYGLATTVPEGLGFSLTPISNLPLIPITTPHSATVSPSPFQEAITFS